MNCSKLCTESLLESAKKGPRQAASKHETLGKRHQVQRAEHRPGMESDVRGMRLQTAKDSSNYHLGQIGAWYGIYKPHREVVKHHAQEQQHFIHGKDVTRTAVSAVSERKKIEPGQVAGVCQSGQHCTCYLTRVKATRIELACIWPQLGMILHNYRTDDDVVPCKLSYTESLANDEQQMLPAGTV